MALVAWHGISGFETAMPVPRSYSRFQVQALDSSRHVIGTSQTFSVS
jgi:hypothetical protein